MKVFYCRDPKIIRDAEASVSDSTVQAKHLSTFTDEIYQSANTNEEPKRMDFHRDTETNTDSAQTMLCEGHQLENLCV